MAEVAIVSYTYKLAALAMLCVQGCDRYVSHALVGAEDPGEVERMQLPLLEPQNAAQANLTPPATYRKSPVGPLWAIEDLQRGVVCYVPQGGTQRLGQGLACVRLNN